MFPINFDKSLAQHFINCLTTGEAIGSVHTLDEITTLAGACFYALIVQGPRGQRHSAEQQGLIVESPQHPEHVEADDAMAFNDIGTAIQFAGILCLMVHEQQYDSVYEEQIACLVGQGGEKRTTIKPIAGFKQPQQKPPETE